MLQTKESLAMTSSVRLTAICFKVQHQMLAPASVRNALPVRFPPPPLDTHNTRPGNVSAIKDLGGVGSSTTDLEGGGEEESKSAGSRLYESVPWLFL